MEFTRKKWKTAILLYCLHTAGVLHIFVLYNLLGPGTSFYRKSKINIKRKPNYEIGWFHNWPWSFQIDSMSFTLQTMIEMDSLWSILYYCTLVHIICEHLHDLYTLNSLSGWKGLKKFIPRDSFNSSLFYSLCIPHCERTINNIS